MQRIAWLLLLCLQLPEEDAEREEMVELLTVRMAEMSPPAEEQAVS